MSSFPSFGGPKQWSQQTCWRQVRKPWEVLFSLVCDEIISDKAVGIHNDCSWNDVILRMTMREVGYTGLRIIYLPSCTFLSQTFKTSSAQDGCFSSSSNALIPYLETKLLKLILKRNGKEAPESRWTSRHWQVCGLKSIPCILPSIHKACCSKVESFPETVKYSDWHEMLVKRKGKNE